MRKFAVILCLAVIFAVPTIVVADETKTSSTTWTYNGYDCELWSEGNQGTTTMTVNGDNGTGANAKGGTFTASWSNTKNILFRCGRKFATTQGGNISGRDPAKPALDYGNISIDFAATWSSNDNVRMLGVYGWAFYAQSSIPTKDENNQNKTFDKAIEYYIIQDRGSYNAAMGGDTKSTLKGEGTIDNIAYEYRVCDRIGRNSISGNSVNFKQYFSVPKDPSKHRTSGKISVSEHFKEWARVGMKMDGPLYEVALKVESYSESGAKGTANVTKNLLTVGGTTPSSSSVASSSSRASSSSVASSSSRASSSSVASSSSRASSSSVASSSSRASSSSVASSSSRASSSSVASSSSRANSSSSAATSSSSNASGTSSSSVAGGSSSSNASETSSSSEADVSSSSEEDTEPILKNRIPLTYFSIQPQSDKSLRIEISSPAVVEIFNLKGNKVTSLNVSSSQTVKLSLPNGVYFAKAHGTKSIRFVLK